MTKEKLIENLRNEASQKVRLERKNKQLGVGLKSLFFLYGVFCIVALIFLPQSPGSLSIVSSSYGLAVILALVILFGGAIILPFGKSTQEKIDETFKKLVNTKVEEKSEYVSKTKSTLVELEQELEILKEL